MDHPGGDVKAMKERLWHMAAHKHPKTKLLLLWHRYLYNEAEMPLMEELCRKAGVHFCPVEGKLLGIEAMMEAFAGVPTYDAVLGRLRTHITDIKEQCAKHRNAPCREQQRSLTLDAWGRLKVCGVAYSKGIIGDYMSMSMEEIERMKRLHPFCAKCKAVGTHNWANETMTWKRRVIDGAIGLGVATLGRVMTLRPTMHRGLSTDEK